MIHKYPIPEDTFYSHIHMKEIQQLQQANSHLTERCKSLQSQIRLIFARHDSFRTVWETSTKNKNALIMVPIRLSSSEQSKTQMRAQMQFDLANFEREVVFFSFILCVYLCFEKLIVRRPVLNQSIASFEKFLNFLLSYLVDNILGFSHQRS